MSNLNRIILVGTVAQKPETRFGTDTGTSMSKFTIQVERPARQDGTVEYDHMPVVAFGKSADYAAERVVANSTIIVEGRIQVRSTETAGQRTWITEIMASSIKTLGAAASAAQAPSTGAAQIASAPVTADNPFDAAFTEDDVPF